AEETRALQGAWPKTGCRPVEDAQRSSATRIRRPATGGSETASNAHPGAASADEEIAELLVRDREADHEQLTLGTADQRPHRVAGRRQAVGPPRQRRHELGHRYCNGPPPTIRPRSPSRTGCFVH